MSGLHDLFDELVADVPAYGDLDRAIEQAEEDRRRRYGIAAGLAAAAAVAAVIAGLAVLNDDQTDSQPVDPATDTPTDAIGHEQPEVLSARQVGRFSLEVAGEPVPGRWQMGQNSHDVWTAGYFDETGYGSPALWWGKGTTTHEVVGSVGGVAISPDARWIVWSRATAGGYDGNPSLPRVMELVDTATGEVRWSRDAAADAPDVGALAVTNDGVVLFGHCLEPRLDAAGWTQCGDVRVDLWAPRHGGASTVPTEMSNVLSTGAPNGFLSSDAPLGHRPSVRPEYVRVSESGDVEQVATLPRSTVAVSADERFALLCDTPAGSICEFSVLPLDGGDAQPMPSLAELVSIPIDYDWGVNPFVVERGDLLVIRSLEAQEASPYPAVARCSLEQARCVQIHRSGGNS